MPSDETIRLILELGNSGKNVQEVAAELDKLGDAAKRADAKIDSVSPTMDKVATSTDKAAKSSKDLGRGVLELSQAFQDFVQGGLGGILNNIDGVVMKFGGTSGLAAAISVVSVAAYVAVPAVKALWSSITDGSNEVPKSTDALAGMSEALKVAKDRLDELRKQQTLTNTELAEFNKLTAESTKLEQESNAQKEAAKARSQKTDDESALGSAFSKISGGANFDKIAESAAGLTGYQAMKAEYDALKNNGRGLTADEGRRFSQLAGNLNAMNPGMNGSNMTAAQDLVNRARKGDVAAFNQLRDQSTGDVRGQLDAIDPAKAGMRGMAKDRARSQISDAIGDVLQPAISGLKERRKNDAVVHGLNEQGRENEAATSKEAQDRNDKLVDVLNSEGDRNEATWRGKNDRDAAKAAADAERARDKAARDALPGTQLNRQQDQAFQAAAGYAVKNNNGEFGPSQLESIAREAANNTQGLDFNSVSQAVQQAAAMARQRMQQQLDRSMQRLQSQYDSAFPY